MQDWTKLLDGEPASDLAHHLRDEGDIMKIIETRYSAVEVEDEQHYRSTVFLQGDGKWKCLRCDRLKCEHALFVKQANPTLPELPPLSEAELADLIDE